MSISSQNGLPHLPCLPVNLWQPGASGLIGIKHIRPRWLRILLKIFLCCLPCSLSHHAPEHPAGMAASPSPHCSSDLDSLSALCLFSAGGETILPGSTNIELLDTDLDDESELRSPTTNAPHTPSPLGMRMRSLLSNSLQSQSPVGAFSMPTSHPTESGTCSPGLSQPSQPPLPQTSHLSSHHASFPGQVLSPQPMVIVPGDDDMSLVQGQEDYSFGGNGLRVSHSLPCLSQMQPDYFGINGMMGASSDGEHILGDEEVAGHSVPTSPTGEMANSMGNGVRRPSAPRPRRPMPSRYDSEVEAVKGGGKKRGGGSGNQAGVTIPNPNGTPCTACGAKVGKWKGNVSCLSRLCLPYRRPSCMGDLPPIASQISALFSSLSTADDTRVEGWTSWAQDAL